MPFITRQWRRLKWEDYLIITVSTFSPDLASIDKCTMAYHAQLNTVFVKSSLKKTWTNNFRSAYRKVSGRMNGKPHASHFNFFRTYIFAFVWCTQTYYQALWSSET